MLTEFGFLNNEQQIYNLVVENGYRIMEMIEFPIQPVQSQLFTPKVEGSDDKMSTMVHETAMQLYGENVPEIVAKRMERELNSIISNGYGVVY